MSVGGIGWPTMLLALQLGVGLLATGDLLRSIAARHFGVATVGQALVAVLLVALGADGLFIGSDLVGRIAYELDLEPSWVRPGLVGLILAGAVLWATDR